MGGHVKYQTNNKRIAKNTFYLYLRMLMVMLVSLFTVRVVLDALGAEDYGIYNVVGGFVTMFSFLTSTLNSASLRFFAYYIGKNDQKKLCQYFTMSFYCFAIMALIILILAETVGLWFILNKLTIPESRINAALWVYHFSIFSFILKILSIPYTSIVIAHEQMNMFALLGVIECLLKLAIAYLLFISPLDKLKTYAVLMFFMMGMIDCFYFIYGLKHFPECKVKKYWNKTLFQEIANYSGWSLFGALSGVLRGQGINILLNIYFNPIVNAARAIAFQINTSINQFVLNFYKAVQPQITKSYGAGDMISMHTLVYRSSRLCFYMILVLSMPVLLETDFILKIWLKNVPDNTTLFTRLVILTAIIDSTSYPLQTAISATGKIKYFQIVTGGLLLLNLPISWFFIKRGYPPEITMYIAIAVSIIAQLTRVLFAKIYSGLSICTYSRDVLLRIIMVAALSYILPIFVRDNFELGLTRFILVTLASLFSCLIFMWTLGLNTQERVFFINFLKARLNVFKSQKRV